MTDDNVVELKQPREDLCDFCQEQEPICDVDMHIRYRALPHDRFRVQVRCCHGCADMLGLDPDDAIEQVESGPALPLPIDPEMARPRITELDPAWDLDMSEPQECTVCAEPAVILTSDGPMCAVHAFGQ